ncbi:C39 family peptidase [Candidatus Omnitrophota bacterium]
MKVVLSIFLILFFVPDLCASSPLSVAFGPGIRKNVKSMQDVSRENMVPQTLDYSCGPASLATIMTYYFGDEVTEGQAIYTLLKTSDFAKVKMRNGFSLLDLKNYSLGRGYDVVGYRMDFQFLVDLNTPVLLPVNIRDYGHFIVFRGYRHGRVYVSDPVLGNLTMKKDEFLRLWEGGVGLVLAKEGFDSPGPLAIGEKEDIRFLFPSSLNARFGIGTIGKIVHRGEF